MARTKAKEPEKKEAAPKRPVMTITLTPEKIETLDLIAESFKRIAKGLPDWLSSPLPKTRAGVAAWLVSEGTTNLLEIQIGLELEKRQVLIEKMAKQGEPDLPKSPYELMTEVELQEHQEFLEKIKSDRFFELVYKFIRSI